METTFVVVVVIVVVAVKSQKKHVSSPMSVATSGL